MIIKPDFYDKFECIAGECDFTCCKEWKIAVDDATASKWKNIAPPNGMKTRRKSLEQFTQYKEGMRVISLDEHICPFLNEDRLCRLVVGYGDDVLSQTCQTFPREKHEYGSRVEYSLMPCCPAVVDLLDTADAFRTIEIDSDEERQIVEKAEGEPKEHSGLWEIRQLLMDILEDCNHSCEQNLLVAFYAITELYNDDNLTIENVSSSIEQMHEAISAMSFDEGEHYAECHELFLDLSENYRKQELYKSYLSDTLNGVQQADSIESYDAIFKQKWDEFQPLLHKYLVQEVYADIMNVDSELDSMLIRLEWIGLEYTLIRHLCFGRFCADGNLDYKKVRDSIVLASRMMGYEEEDIYDYLENSFEDIIWQWGYFALVVGK